MARIKVTNLLMYKMIVKSSLIICKEICHCRRARLIGKLSTQIKWMKQQLMHKLQIRVIISSQLYLMMSQNTISRNRPCSHHRQPRDFSKMMVIKSMIMLAQQLYLKALRTYSRRIILHNHCLLQRLYKMKKTTSLLSNRTLLVARKRMLWYRASILGKHKANRLEEKLLKTNR